MPLYSGVIGEHAVGGTDLVAETADGRGHLALHVDLLVVERQLTEAVHDLHDGAGGRLVAQGLGDAAVDGLGAEAAEQDDDAGVRAPRGDRRCLKTDRGPLLFRSSRDLPTTSLCRVHDLLPMFDQPPRERSDAARNREALLAAAARLVEDHGVDAVTMDSVAAAAGVGKGTVFRRFDSREGLMAALLNRSETEWQGLVISGPPPLGPGAPAIERLHAFGHSRMEVNLQHAELIRAAGRARRAFVRRRVVRRDAHEVPAEPARRPRRPVLPGHRAARPARDGRPRPADPTSRRSRSTASRPAGTTSSGAWCAARSTAPTRDSSSCLTSRAGAGRARGRPPRPGRTGRSAAPPRRAGRPASRRPGGRRASSAAAARRPACP